MFLLLILSPIPLKEHLQILELVAFPLELQLGTIADDLSLGHAPFSFCNIRSGLLQASLLKEVLEPVVQESG